MEINSKKLLQITTAKYISFDEKFRLEFVTFGGGNSEWIISVRNKYDKYFTAIASAPTFDEAREKYYSIAKALA